MAQFPDDYADHTVFLSVFDTRVPRTIIYRLFGMTLRSIIDDDDGDHLPVSIFYDLIR